MKKIIDIILLLLVSISLSIPAYMIGYTEAEQRNLSEFKNSVDSIIVHYKQVGYDSAVFEIQQDNLRDLKNR